MLPDTKVSFFFKIHSQLAQLHFSLDLKMPNEIKGFNYENHSRFYFCGCSGLTSINIPNSVTSIGDWAFEGCSNLDIVIDNSKDNLKVGNQAFYLCKSVTWLKD